MTGKSKYPKREEAFINPSLLSADFANLQAEMRKVERAGCRWVHLDVMDGHFVPNLTIGPVVVRALRNANPRLFFDTHLMIENPLKYSAEFAEAGANLITVHEEACELDTAIRALRRHKIQVGVSIKPKTPVEKIEPFLKRIDLVLIMSVEPGFGGQSLIPNTLNKVRQLAILREKHRHRYQIEIDGGINIETAPLAAAAGAGILVAGSAVFANGKVAESIQALRNAIKGLS